MPSFADVNFQILPMNENYPMWPMENYSIKKKKMKLVLNH